MPHPTLSSTGRAIRDRLTAACLPDEVVSPIVPQLLAAGRWWPADRPWPEPLTAGLIEPRRGYRFKPENATLALLLHGQRAERLLDLGAGSGSLLLIAWTLTRPAHAAAIERQPEQLDRLRRTLRAHAIPAPALQADLRAPATHRAALDALGGRPDLIVANPPFFPTGWGRPSREPSTHLSTHAEHGGVAEFITAGADLLAPTGRMLVVFDAARLAHLMAAVGDADLRVERVAWIPDQRRGAAPDPFRVWVTLARQGTEITRLIDSP